MPIDIAEFDSIEECLASMEGSERDLAVIELWEDGYWDLLRANGDSSESCVV